MGNLETMKYLSHVIFGIDGIFISCIYLYIVHSSPYLCVCGDDRIIYYPVADDVSGEPGDTYWRRVGSAYEGILELFLFNFPCNLITVCTV